MKTYVILGIAFLISLSSFAQQGINYKAIIKDSGGNLLTNSPVGFQFDIFDNLANNVYEETHVVITDNNGIAIVNIGEGDSSDDFTIINWGNNEFTLGVSVNTGSGFVNLGLTPFKSVPYAIHAYSLKEDILKLNGLADVKSDDDGSQDGSSIFIGVNSGLLDNSSNNRNVSVGFETLKTNTTGYNNTAIGHSALKTNLTGHSNIANGANALELNTTGQSNIAIGVNALKSNTEGLRNIATGVSALESNTTGNDNIAIGTNALIANTNGYNNIAHGRNALSSNTTGYENIAIGRNTLNANTTGRYNTVIGNDAREAGITSWYNTVVGYNALSLSNGDYNTAFGSGTLNATTDGEKNVAMGANALGLNRASNNTAIGFETSYANTTGFENTATGFHALRNNSLGHSNTAAGAYALLNNYSGDQNTAVGRLALSTNTSGNNNIAIGYNAAVPSSTGSNQVRMGNTTITYAGIQVAWTVTSDKRWKNNIRELPYGLDMVMQLRPVDYTRKNNANKTREMGFIAQDLEALLAQLGYADQGFLSKDDDGYLSLRYNDLIALLTNAIQEQQNLIESHKTEIKKLSIDNSSLKNSVHDLMARVDKIEANNQ